MKKLFAVILFVTLSSAAFSQIHLSLQGGVQIPTGDFSDFANTGFGGSATFEYLQNSPLSFTGMLGYYVWDREGEQPDNVDYSYRTIPIMLGIRYYFDQYDFAPYFGTELGIHLWQTEIEVEKNNSTITTEASESNFGITPMFGFKYRLSTSVDLDVNLKYNIVSGDGPSTSFVGLNFGVQFGL